MKKLSYTGGLLEKTYYKNYSYSLTAILGCLTVIRVYQSILFAKASG